MIVCPSKHDSFRRVKPTTLISYSNFNAGDPLRAFFYRNADFWNKFPSGNHFETRIIYFTNSPYSYNLHASKSYS